MTQATHPRPGHSAPEASSKAWAAHSQGPRGAICGAARAVPGAARQRVQLALHPQRIVHARLAREQT